MASRLVAFLTRFRAPIPFPGRALRLPSYMASEITLVCEGKGARRFVPPIVVSRTATECRAGRTQGGSVLLISPSPDVRSNVRFGLPALYTIGLSEGMIGIGHCSRENGVLEEVCSRVPVRGAGNLCCAPRPVSHSVMMFWGCL